MKNTEKAGIERVLDEMEKWADDEEKNCLYDCRNLGTDAVRGWATVMREHLAGGQGMRPKYNHSRFRGDLVKALHAWSQEDQNFDIKSDIEANGEDPNSLVAILDYWTCGQLVEFIEWLFERVEEAE